MRSWIKTSVRGCTSAGRAGLKTSVSGVFIDRDTEVLYGVRLESQWSSARCLGGGNRVGIIQEVKSTDTS